MSLIFNLIIGFYTMFKDYLALYRKCVNLMNLVEKTDHFTTSLDSNNYSGVKERKKERISC